MRTLALTLALFTSTTLAHDLSKAGFPEQVASLDLAPGAGGTLHFKEITLEVPRGSFQSRVHLDLLRGTRSDWQTFDDWDAAAPKNSDVLDAFAVVVTDVATNKHLLKIPALTYTLNDVRVGPATQLWASGDAAPLRLAKLPLDTPTLKAALGTGQLSFTLTDAAHGWVVTTPTMPSTAITAPATVTVNLEHLAFNPAQLTIPAGTTVTFVQKDSVPHNVVINDVMESPPELSLGQVFSYTFVKSGTYKVYCEIHPFMTLTVTVK